MSSAKIRSSSACVRQASTAVEEIVVTGTRNPERRATDSVVPVDLLQAEALQSVPSADLNDKLAQLIPSFKVERLPLSDGAVFVRPATLRGLSPDHTLVLVNGVRRHRSAYVATGESGAQSVGLSQIPQIAIKRIEVLRDGASAQYGSDAIAGVVNILLDDTEGFSIDAASSQYYAGDGVATQAAARAGFSIFDAGTLNLAGEYQHSKQTDRGTAVNKIGQPALEAGKLFYNLRVPLDDALSLYSFGNYNETRGRVEFGFRDPGGDAYARSYYQDNPP